MVLQDLVNVNAAFSARFERVGESLISQIRIDKDPRQSITRSWCWNCSTVGETQRLATRSHFERVFPIIWRDVQNFQNFPSGTERWVFSATVHSPNPSSAPTYPNRT